MKRVYAIVMFVVVGLWLVAVVLSARAGVSSRASWLLLGAAGGALLLPCGDVLAEAWRPRGGGAVLPSASADRASSPPWRCVEIHCIKLTCQCDCPRHLCPLPALPELPPPRCPACHHAQRLVLVSDPPKAPVPLSSSTSARNPLRA